MIISVSEINDFISSVDNISDNDPFACRIISLYNCYALGLPFVDYWMITDDFSGKCTGAVARSGTDFILFLTSESNIDEVSSFMRVAGVSSVICNADYKLDLYPDRVTYGAVLMKSSPFEIGNISADFVAPDIKEAYELIVKCADENFTPPEFDDFYVDVNHKLRHKTMRICGLRKDSRLTSVAMTVAESSNGAVLGAVACDPDYRKQGYGSETVKYISNLLIAENKTVYLHRAENANVSFYDNLGFTEIGKWSEYYFER